MHDYRVKELTYGWVVQMKNYRGNWVRAEDSYFKHRSSANERMRRMITQGNKKLERTMGASLMASKTFGAI